MYRVNWPWAETPIIDKNGGPCPLLDEHSRIGALNDAAGGRGLQRKSASGSWGKPLEARLCARAAAITTFQAIVGWLRHVGECRK